MAHDTAQPLRRRVAFVARAAGVLAVAPVVAFTACGARTAPATVAHESHAPPAASPSASLTPSAPLPPPPLLPLMIGGGAVPCGNVTCRAGEEVCCIDHCMRFANVNAATRLASITEACGGAQQFGTGTTLVACSDSSQCTPNASCCPVPVQGRMGRMTPFRPKRPELIRAQACTEDPAHDCAELEVCADATCRAPRPDVAIPCGGAKCSGNKPICRYDGSPAAPGQPQLPPVCTSKDATARTMPELIVSCIGPRDCPRDAQCVLFSFASLDSYCMYNLDEMIHGDVAPTCRTDHDCESILPRWRQYMDEGSRNSYRSHCRPIATDPAKRSACSVPWLAR